jgi:hypothetical protein
VFACLGTKLMMGFWLGSSESILHAVALSLVVGVVIAAFCTYRTRHAYGARRIGGRT